MTTETMTVYDGLEVIGEIPATELPALIRCRKVLQSPLGTCRWVYDIFGPTGEVLAIGIKSHADARRIALHHGYVPVECWASTPREEVR